MLCKLFILLQHLNMFLYGVGISSSGRTCLGNSRRIEECLADYEELRDVITAIENDSKAFIDIVYGDVTDENGWLHFQTNVTVGIILREHELYYLQEIAAPPNHRLDNTKHWFCFCDKTAEGCSVCDQVLANKANGFRIPFEQIGVVRASNEYINYNLPATGGGGTQFIILVGAAFVAVPIVYKLLRRRKQGRGGRWIISSYCDKVSFKKK